MKASLFSPLDTYKLYSSEIIRRVSERNLSQRTLVAKCNISKGAVCNSLKREQEYLKDYESNQSADVKRKTKSEFGKNINDGLYSWFVA